MMFYMESFRRKNAYVHCYVPKQSNDTKPPCTKKLEMKHQHVYEIFPCVPKAVCFFYQRK